MKEHRLFPFTAVVGQERMKTALLLNAINPAIGGVLIRGVKGTAKSTLVRSLEHILPPYKSEEEQEHMRVVELPINATEDRVAGTINMEKAIKTGEKSLEPGILAYAHHNILYVDEINLLDDHIVDIILDAAAMGVNHIEREGISAEHPSRFILIGTMNPEEGDLRPQLLDRFGLVVDVESEKSLENRILLMERRLDFEHNPDQFIENYTEEENNLRQRIVRAKELLPQVSYQRDMIEAIAKACMGFGLEGHRGEITALKVALALAAWRGSANVESVDVQEALGYVLPHRLRKLPFEKGELDLKEINRLLEEQQCIPSQES